MNYLWDVVVVVECVSIVQEELSCDDGLVLKEKVYHSAIHYLSHSPLPLPSDVTERIEGSGPGLRV